jgi:hypothetical protein
MSTRNSSRDAEEAQDAADFGGTPSTHRRDLQDDGGHVTFRRSTSGAASGPNHMDQNFNTMMEQVVASVYEEDQE